MSNKIFVFSDGIYTYAKSQSTLEQEYGKENPVAIEQELNDVQLAYTLKPFRYLDVLGRSDDQFYVVVDLSDQDEQNAFSDVAGDVEILHEGKAIEAFDERGYQPAHYLCSYNDETISMLRHLDDTQEVSWTRQKRLTVKHEHLGGIKSLKLPPAQPDDALFIEHQLATSS